MKLTGYLMAPVRGLSGDNATIEEIDANIAEALRVGDWLREKFPEVKWIIPHEHEVIVRQLWLDGYITSEQIVSSCTKLAARCDLGVMYIANGISSGMGEEVAACCVAHRPLVLVRTTSKWAEKDVSRAISALKNEKLRKEKKCLNGS